MQVPFLKLHGLGNDFVLLDETSEEVIPEGKKEGFAQRFCDRHTGIGADGVIFIGKKGSVVTFRIFNADGSEAEMCVNGIRCASLALRLRLATDLGDTVEMLTPGGTVTTRVLHLGKSEGMIEVETLFAPRYEGRRTIAAGGREIEYHLVNVGNPHAVAFVDEDLPSLDVEGIGHEMEQHEAFAPDGVNTEFVNLVEPGRLRMRVHERGACETRACGSGAIASATVAGRIWPGQPSWAVEMPGGTLDIILGRRTLVRGPAALVYEGRLLLWKYV